MISNQKVNNILVATKYEQFSGVILSTLPFYYIICQVHIVLDLCCRPEQVDVHKHLRNVVINTALLLVILLAIAEQRRL